MSSDHEQEQEKKQSKTVKSLAEKLQSGWALLAQTCPQCNTPLVREKGGKRMFCVSCELWVVRESDLSDEQQKQQQQQEQSPKQELKSEPATAAAVPESSSHLESGLASLSDHALFEQTRRELRAENDGSEGEEDTDYSSRPNQTAIAAKQRLDEYARSKAARASRARAAEEEEFEMVATTDEAALAQHASRMDSLSAKLGAKMMAGWTLMGDLCPNQQCTCPLMRARGETINMLCVNCGAKVVKQGDELIITAPGSSVPVGSKTNAAPATAPAAAAAAAAPSASTSVFRSSTGRRRGGRQTRRQREQDSDDDDEDEDEDEEQLLRQAEREEADKVSASLERKTAPKPPPPQQQQQPQVSFDIEDPYSLAGLPADLSDAGQRSGAGAGGAPANKSDDVSSKLGEKMLQGYALLGQVCPRDGCNCPLVRKRDGPMLCVSCGSTIIDEADHDEAVHGPAGNVAGEDGKIAVNPAAAAAAKQQQQSTSGRVVTPVKRFASPSVSDLHDSEQTEKKSRSDSRPAVRVSDSPSVGSPLVGSPRHAQQSGAAGTGSGSSSGLPSPLQGSRSRAQSECMDAETAEAAIDPRLRQQTNFRSQLGGKSGRFNPPHSRAPSLAVSSSLLPKLHHTSSAALNAAAHMAFSKGSEQSQQMRSGHSSLEQSPRMPLATPPATPIVAMSLSGHQHQLGHVHGQSHGSMLLPAGMHALHGAASSSSTSRYPQSRHPSVNFGAASLAPVPASLARGSLLHTGSMSPTQFAHTEATHAPAMPSFAITHAAATTAVAAPIASDSSSDVSLNYASLLSSTQSTLMSKLEECRQLLAASANLAECRELAATMRDMVTTIQHISQAQEQM